MNNLEVFNQSLFLRINAGAGTPAWTINAAIVIANDLIYLIPILLLAFWLWGNEAKRNLVLKACLVALLGLGLNQLVGLAWPHPRPFMIGLGHTWLPHAADSSFPSDHMTICVGVGLTLLLDGALWCGLVTLIGGLGVAWARVFLGVHFPLDMLGASAMACVTYMLITTVWQFTGITVTRWVIAWHRKILAQPIRLGWLRR